MKLLRKTLSLLTAITLLTSVTLFAKDKADKPAKTPKVEQKGAIEKLDAAAGSLSVGGKDFKLGEKSKVAIDGTAKSLTDLKVGDEVVVIYMVKEDGSNVAGRVYKGEIKKKGDAAAGSTAPAGGDDAAK